MIEKTVPKAIRTKINEDEMGGGIGKPLVDEVVSEALIVWLCEVDMAILVVVVVVELTAACI
jgi:hypothetical protein